MPQNMRYRLALDLGSTSLGWAIFLLNSDNPPRPKSLIKAGVRIFPNGRENAPIGQQGESLAKVRREKRQARRRRDRQLKRKNRLVSALIKWGFFPTDEAERRKLETLDPYKLRFRGLSEALSKHEFGRALFHLNQRRGFKSNRKTDTDEKTVSAMKETIERTRTAIYAEFQTLGAWLYHRGEIWKTKSKSGAEGASPVAVIRAKQREELRQNKRDPEKTVSKTVYDIYVDRKMIKDEFDALWLAQSKLSAVPLSEDARAAIEDTIFFQRKLRPVHPGKCSLLPQLRRAYKAFPLVQQLRIYQEVSHLEILDEQLNGIKLSKSQRDQIAKHLCQGKSLTFTGIRKLLKLPGTTVFNRENGADRCEGLEGDQTASVMCRKDYFDARWSTEFSDTLKHQIVWKILHAQRADLLSLWLQRKTGIREEQAEKIMKALLPNGVSAYSLRVTSRVLLQLKNEVLTIDKAIGLAGLGSHSQLSHFMQTGELLRELPYYGEYLPRHVGLGSNDPSEHDDAKRWGRISNPTVHVGLNQIRIVINAIIKRYGVTPHEVIIELARELKLNAKQRDAANLQNLKNREDNKKRREKFPGMRLSVDDMDMLKLWEELNPSDAANRCCPYTGNPISMSQLFSPGLVQVEHILPFSQTTDNSLNNKTLAFSTANLAKANRTPHEAFGGNPVINGITYDYDAILQRAKNMKREKYMRFAPDGFAWWLKNEADFPARALTDTQYLSKLAKEYLSLICNENRVWATPGRLTSFIREKFGFDALLNGSNKKNRDDHRHHAIDACVIGVTDRWLIKEIATANARAQEKRIERLLDFMPHPWATYTDQVKRAITAISISHKPDHSFEGRMFEEKAYGFNIDGSIKQQHAADGNEKKTTIKTIVSIDHRFNAGGLRTSENVKKTYKGYVPFGNFCMEIVCTPTGLWDFEVIPTHIAYKQAIAFGWGQKASDKKRITKQISTTKLSTIPGKLVMKLIAGDCVALTENRTRKVLIVTKMSTEGGATFTELSESNYSARALARGKARKKAKANPESLTFDERRANEDSLFISQIGVKELQTKQARRVTISPIGELRDPGFKE
jgi:CRISPR-associated endonuclease Csn1